MPLGLSAMEPPKTMSVTCPSQKESLRTWGYHSAWKWAKTWSTSSQIDESDFLRWIFHKISRKNMHGWNWSALLGWVSRSTMVSFVVSSSLSTITVIRGPAAYPVEWGLHSATLIGESHRRKCPSKWWLKKISRAYRLSPRPHLFSVMTSLLRVISFSLSLSWHLFSGLSSFLASLLSVSSVFTSPREVCKIPRNDLRKAL